MLQHIIPASHSTSCTSCYGIVVFALYRVTFPYLAFGDSRLALYQIVSYNIYSIKSHHMNYYSITSHDSLSHYIVPHPFHITLVCSHVFLRCIGFGRGSRTGLTASTAPPPGSFQTQALVPSIKVKRCNGRHPQSAKVQSIDTGR